MLELDDRTRGAGRPDITRDAQSAARRASPDTPTIRRARWEHQLGDAYLGLGQLGPARTHLHAALTLLNRRMPAGGRRLAVGLAWQIAQQARNRLWPGSPVARSPENRAALLEAAEVYERLYVLDFYANRRAEAIHEAVKGLNLAEAAGSMTAVARLTVLCGVSIGFLALHRLAEVYLQRALTLANKAADPLAHAWALPFAALYGTGMGRWVQVTAQLEDAVEIMRQVGDRRRLGELNALRACVAYFQGDLAAAAPLFAERRHWRPCCTSDTVTGRRPARRSRRRWSRFASPRSSATGSSCTPPPPRPPSPCGTPAANAAPATNRPRGQPRSRPCAGCGATLECSRSGSPAPCYARDSWPGSTSGPCGPGKPGAAASPRLSDSACAMTRCWPTNSSAGTAPRPSATSTWPAPTSFAPNSGPAARSLTRRRSPHISPDSYSRRASQARRSAMERLLWIAHQHSHRGTWALLAPAWRDADY